jgi:RHS repeat-associated protein
MMPAVKHLDPVLGIDIHFIVTPPGAVVPIPHPHIGIVFDPFDYIPIIGSTVNVNGLPRAQAGTGGVALPPHFPIGGAFAKPPGNENETFMGSSTVIVDGEPFTYMTLPVLSCQDIGMPSPPRKKGPGAKTLLLPTSIALSIPAGPPVIVGGPPTISLSGLVLRLGLSALFKGLKKLRKLQKASRKMKDLSDRIHDAAKKIMDKRGLGQRAQDWVHKKICTFTGHPVDVVTGRMMTDAVDWELPGPLPIKFERNYSSGMSWRDSVLGHGWSHSLDLALWEEQGQVVYRAEDGREIEFDIRHYPKQRLPPGQQVFDPINRLTLRRLGELRWEVESTSGLVHEFRWVAGEKQPGLCRVVRTRTRVGHAIHYEYDAHGQLEWVVDNFGRRLRFEYGEGGRLSRTWLPHPTQPGLVPYNRYMYSEAGDLVEVFDAMGRATRFEYERHLMVRETDRKGLSFYFEYEAQGPQSRCVHTWGDGGIYDHRLVYDKARGLTEVTNSLGHTTVYQSDGRGVVVRKVDPLGHVWHYKYDEALRKTTETDPLGNTVHRRYDARGNCTRLIQPDGAVFELQYDDLLDQPSRIVDPGEGVWLRQYDDYGRLCLQENPMGEKTRYLYDRRGLLQAIIDPVGRRTDFQYDPNGNLAQARWPDQTTSTFQHDHLGRLIRVVDTIGQRHEASYDACGRMVRRSDPAGENCSIIYDPEGNVLSRSELEGRTFRFAYALRQSVRSMQDPSGRTVHLDYDTEGQLTGVRNEAGERYQYVRDACGRVLQQIGFDGRVHRYDYDAAGRIVRITRPSGATSEIQYDEAGRPLLVTRSDGTFDRYRYRPGGTLVEATNPTSTVCFERDALGRILQESHGEHWIASRYGADGRRLLVETSLGVRQSTGYDPVGGLLSCQVTAPEQTSTDWQVKFQMNTAGQESRRYLLGNVIVSWTRDEFQRPRQRTVSRGIQQLETRNYSWNKSGQIAGISHADGSVAYEYDQRSFLIAARHSSGHIEQRAVDDVGNIYGRQDRTDRVYAAGGELREANGIRHVHDADGQLIRKELPDGTYWAFEYDASGLLITVRDPRGHSIHFTYDALGRRVSKTAQGQTTRWLWDGNVPMHEYVDKVSPTTWIMHPESLTLLGVMRGGRFYGAVNDDLGTPTELVDETGTITWQARMDLNGLLSARHGIAADCPWRYPGQYEDPETGLYYNRFRYYDPSIGRYTVQDPIGLGGGLSAYGYVRDPLRQVDLFGLSCKVHPPQPDWFVKGVHIEASNGVEFLLKGVNEKLILDVFGKPAKKLEKAALKEVEDFLASPQGPQAVLDQARKGLNHFSNNPNLVSRIQSVIDCFP